MTKKGNRTIKIIFGSLWGCLFIVALIAWWRSGLALTEIPLLLNQSVHHIGLFKVALLYMIIYTVRPLILFPASILTASSGLIFGPWLGVLFTVVGENASANLGFFLARWFGRKAVKAHSSTRISRWDQKLEEQGLVAVLTMRLIMLPFDAVNFACGLTAIRHRDYALGTFIGILPSLIGFVLLGGIAAPGVNNRVLVVGLSIFFMVLGFGLAHYLKRREQI